MNTPLQRTRVPVAVCKERGPCKAGRSLGIITFGRDVAVLLEELLTSEVAHSACFQGRRRPRNATNMRRVLLQYLRISRGQRMKASGLSLFLVSRVRHVSWMFNFNYSHLTFRASTLRRRYPETRPCRNLSTFRFRVGRWTGRRSVFIGQRVEVFLDKYHPMHLIYFTLLELDP